MKLQNLITIETVELIELSAGRRPEVVVGTLPYEVRRYLGCSRDTIFLSGDSIGHIIQKHGDHIELAQIRLLPEILFAGLWLKDSRPTHAIVSWEIETVSYKAVVKVTEDRRRTYVKTLHRTSPRQKASLLRNTNILRNSLG